MIDTSLNSALASSLYGNTSTSTLLGGASGGGNKGLDLTNALTSRYIDQSATKLDLSEGLADFIKENVTDEGQKASLLADLEAIQNFTNNVSGENAPQSATASLLGVRDDDGSAGLLNLFA